MVNARDLVVRGEDWYARELGPGTTYTGCTFYDTDWTEVVNASSSRRSGSWR
jgi:hypothetical protein